MDHQHLIRDSESKTSTGMVLTNFNNVNHNTLIIDKLKSDLESKNNILVETLISLIVVAYIISK